MGDDPLLGQTIGSYRITSCIGQGGMGRVYLGVHPQIGARVAIKVLAKERAHDIVELERFFTEARLVNLVRHENIVNVLDMLVLPDGSPCIVMEHLEGMSLAARIAARAPMPVAEVGRLALEILGALAAAHDKGVVHRDLKPENVFVTPGGHAKVLDFGIAKLLGSVPGTGPTRAGAFLGTPAYLAPEQVREARDIDGRADLYSLGVVLFEALSGRLPFMCASTFDLLRAHVEQAPPQLLDVAPGVPPEIARIVHVALNKEPGARHPTARAMAADLARALESVRDDDAVPSTVPMPPQPTAPPPAPIIPPAQLSTFSAANAAVVVRPPRAPSHAWIPFAVAAFVALAAALVLMARVAAVPLGLGRETPPHAMAFDVSAFLPEALVRARRIAPDATLSSFDATPVNRDGSVDLTMVGGSEAKYTFVGTKNGQRLVIFVVATANRLSTLESVQPILPHEAPPPSCSVRGVLKRANLTEGEQFQVVYRDASPAPGPHGMWYVTSTSAKGSRILLDDCPR